MAEPSAIGRLFPAGGPVEPALLVGRQGEVAEISGRLSEGVHIMLTGARRIGKTSVCKAVAEEMREADAVIIEIEVPERTISRDLLQDIIDRCNRAYPAKRRVGLGVRIARPLFEELLRDQGIPLDLSQLTPEPSAPQQRQILTGPLHVAEALDRPVVFFLDELQRAADYADGEQLLIDIVDIYSGQDKVVVLLDGSDERTLDKLFDRPVGLKKLVHRVALSPTIPLEEWRSALRRRYPQAGLEIDGDALEMILDFGEGRPYETMLVARSAGLIARRLEVSVVDREIAGFAIKEGKEQLADE
jgi:hypothetical protein